MGGSQRLCLAGASVHNGNRGVEALGRSVLDVVASDGSRQISVFDDGWGVRPDDSGRYAATVEHVGVRVSRRWHRPESWAQIRVAQALGGLNNAVARRLATADAVLDISGGDSFTDMYGDLRLRIVTEPKRAALRASRPLVLLPQTYGPFRTEAGRTVARRIINRVALAYARDPASYERLLELDAGESDPERLRQGVDVAFALEARRPVPEVAEQVDNAAGDELVGVNVSGLLARASAREEFGLAGDYLTTMAGLVDRMVSEGARVMLLPHVHVPGGGGESDAEAIARIRESLTPQVRAATFAVPAELDAAELKWCVSRARWFVGSRMHATIAALSTGVPAYGYAYSDKTLGVFETCAMGDHVGDARQHSGSEAIEMMVDAFMNRDDTRKVLAENVGPVVEQARGQLHDVLTEVQAWSQADQGVSA